MAEQLASFPSLSSTGPSSLGPDSLGLGDEDPKFVNESDQIRFQCPVHKGILRDARQTSCGHRICARCVEKWLDGAPSKPCPVGEPDCSEVTLGSVFPDRSTVRDMKNLLVECRNKDAGCKVQPKLKDLLGHLEECDYQPIPCDNILRGCNEKILRRMKKKHQEECPFRPVRCQLCKEEVNNVDMKNHLDELCPEQVVGCPFGCDNRTLKRREVLDHRDVCPVHPVDCKFKHMGCKFVGKREVVGQHEKNDLSQHLELVTQHVAQLELNSMDAQRHIRDLMTEREELQQSLQSSRSQDMGVPSDQARRIETQIRDLKLKLVTAVEKVLTVENKMPELVERPRVEAVEQTVTGLRQRLTQLEQQRERDQRQQSSSGGSGGGSGVSGSTPIGQYGSVENMAASFSTQLTAHDRQLGVHDVRMAEMDLRFQLLETASYDGTLIWKIRDYARRKGDAVNGRTLSLYSQPFYSNRFGYKMCSRVYLNGDGMGKTTHLSLFFVVMRGEYDPLLTWPFRQKVTMTLLDQSPAKRHLTDNFSPDPNSSSFQRPTSEMNVASGCPLFVSHAVLESTTNGYLKDDTIFIRIVVDPNHTVGGV